MFQLDPVQATANYAEPEEVDNSARIVRFEKDLLDSELPYPITPQIIELRKV
jgi:hypothetical protein